MRQAKKVVPEPRRETIVTTNAKTMKAATHPAAKEGKRQSFLLRYPDEEWKKIERWADEHHMTIQGTLHRFIAMGLMLQKATEEDNRLYRETSNGERVELVIPL